MNDAQVEELVDPSQYAADEHLEIKVPEPSPSTLNSTPSPHPQP